MQSMQMHVGSAPRLGGQPLTNARRPQRYVPQKMVIRAAAQATTPKGTVMDDQVELGKTGEAVAVFAFGLGQTPCVEPDEGCCGQASRSTRWQLAPGSGVTNLSGAMRRMASTARSRSGACLKQPLILRVDQHAVCTCLPSNLIALT